MYILAKQLKKLPVISLQTGQSIGLIDKPLINQDDLEVAALWCHASRFSRKKGIILIRDIRQFATDCIIIDSFDEIEDPNEIIRLHKVAEHDFEPIGKLVVNESGQQLGRVQDYTINLGSNLLQKLYVHQSLMKSLMFNNLVIDRTQIIDVSQKRFTVQDAIAPETELAPQSYRKGRYPQPKRL
ncbi:MAG TPA: hypothetical protein VNA68_03540 [Candidatus Dormibacteraeota bacterium]|nr:hypothetical protein [Candidatus Dormibacteraeota bacterium]